MLSSCLLGSSQPSILGQLEQGGNRTSWLPLVLQSSGRASTSELSWAQEIRTPQPLVAALVTASRHEEIPEFHSPCQQPVVQCLGRPTKYRIPGTQNCPVIWTLVFGILGSTDSTTLCNFSVDQGLNFSSLLLSRFYSFFSHISLSFLGITHMDANLIPYASSTPKCF